MPVIVRRQLRDCAASLKRELEGVRRAGDGPAQATAAGS